MSETVELNAAKLDTETDDVFGRIAERYDLLCDIFSVLSHRRWKQELARQIVATDGTNFVDVASGTGHIVHRVTKLIVANPKHQRKSILATDLSEKMLAVARRKDKGTYADIKYSVSSAYHLKDVTANSVDILSISFAMKITDRHQVLREAARVLKPGGTFFCLEAARIPIPIIHRAYLAYMNVCLPVMATIATGGDRSAYDYLLRGIHNFPDQRELCVEIAAHGFKDVTYQNMSLGIVALHRATKA
jgi:demethylmenaquinone methyltransferase / 2-methoxy-6-polyprenyl-1,4-benzoquinol methylase